MSKFSTLCMSITVLIIVINLFLTNRTVNKLVDTVTKLKEEVEQLKSDNK